jgi:hypothetical protein
MLDKIAFAGIWRKEVVKKTAQEWFHKTQKRLEQNIFFSEESSSPQCFSVSQAWPQIVRSGFLEEFGKLGSFFCGWQPLYHRSAHHHHAKLIRVPCLARFFSPKHVDKNICICRKKAHEGSFETRQKRLRMKIQSGLSALRGIVQAAALLRVAKLGLGHLIVGADLLEELGELGSL